MVGEAAEVRDVGGSRSIFELLDEDDLNVRYGTILRFRPAEV